MDGDDFLFERIFFAVERRHRGLPAELNGLTDNLQPLARFLIRRAQLKGPYDLLHRHAQPSEAWKKYESVRLMQIAVENTRGMYALSPDLLPHSRKYNALHPLKALHPTHTVHNPAR